VGDPPGRALAAALRQVEGRIQHVVKGRYVEQAVLAQVLAEIPEAASLEKQLRGQDPDATRPARIRLGEIINNAITAKREADTGLWVKSRAPGRAPRTTGVPSPRNPSGRGVLAHQRRMGRRKPVPHDEKRAPELVGVAGFEPAASSSRTEHVS